jgi:hypothetical protein
MALDLTKIKPAVHKAKEIATEEYVDTSLRSINVAQSVSNNNEQLALDMGFTTYSAMKTAYTSLGTTIISGGHINTGLIDANALNITGTEGTSSVQISKDGIKVVVGGVTRVAIGKIS